MALYQILFWQEIPSQIRVWDDVDETKIALSQRCVARIDQAAQEQGLTGSDEYLAQWRWSETEERAGSVEEVAELLKNELEGGFSK